MTVGEVKAYIASFKDEQEFMIEMVPNFKMSVKPLPDAVEPVAEAKEAEIVSGETKSE